MSLVTEAGVVIRLCDSCELETVSAVINESAAAYRGVIPDDCWRDPYMTGDELRHAVDEGVVFWGYEENGELVGVMGLQHVQGVALIPRKIRRLFRRHAYVRTAHRNRGIGGALLSHLRRQAVYPLLVGTWAAAAWAVRFYEERGFRLVSSHEKDRLLRQYRSVPARQIEASVVLADEGDCT